MQLDVLLALYESPLASGELVDRVESLRRQDLALATFYRQVQRTVDIGWIESAETTGEPAGRGRPQREYRITEAGKEVLRGGMELLGRRVELARGLGVLGEERP